jgi:hypothetical protein
MIHKAIIVWEFHNAPEEYQRLSGHGGDEDWLAFVPDSLKDAYIGWIDGGNFGCCDVSTHPVDGGVVKIGAHA